jgi:hypothetical protein
MAAMMYLLHPPSARTATFASRALVAQRTVCCAFLVRWLQVLSELLEHLGDRHWMYSAALCSLAALHEARGDYEQVRLLG